MRRMLLAFGLLPWCIGASMADDPQKERLTCQNTSAIRWFLPGQFEEARAHAEKTKRILMVKGISFGIDAVGAKCATKGNW
ncbi:MAG: hypothetical protein HY040_08590 [Planctomycetes bacterium]|nr:hypothetical protein [Planctomycetota bacterium]